MADHPIMLTVPEEIYARLRQVAETTAQPIEQVMLDQLKTAFVQPSPALPPDEQAELDALRYLSDDALWTIAAEQMPESVQARMQVLMDRNNFGEITPEEYKELEELVERGNRLMVRKAEAAVLLKRRGLPFEQRDFTRKHE